MHDLLESWRRTLRARARSEATIDPYLADLRSLDEWLTARSLDLTEATRRELETYLAELREAGKAPATIARRYRSFLRFYKWAEAEDEVDESPMAKMKPPKVSVEPPPLIADDDLVELLAACDTPRGGPGRAKPLNPDKATFENKRDRTLIMLLSTTGICAGEIMGLQRDHVDLNRGVFTVMGKGSRPRIVALMLKPADALDKYLRVRRDTRTPPCHGCGSATRDGSPTPGCASSSSADATTPASRTSIRIGSATPSPTRRSPAA